MPFFTTILMSEPLLQKYVESLRCKAARAAARISMSAAPRGRTLDVVDDIGHTWNFFYSEVGIAPIGVANGPASQNHIVADQA